MATPKFHYLPERLKKRILDETGCSIAECQIYVLREDNLAWSIVLSYLMSVRPGKCRISELKQRLNIVTGRDISGASALKSVLLFNPFRNNKSYFYDKNLKQVISSFKEQLNWSSLNTREKLKSASDLLQVQIIQLSLYDHVWKEQIVNENCCDSKNSITLFRTLDSPSDQERSSVICYSFGLTKPLAINLRNTALRAILLNTKLPTKIINGIVSISNQKDPFILSVLKSSFASAVPQIYSSSYTVYRLREAGFETHPRVRDEAGFSALYHALVVDDLNVFMTLYLYAANACHKTDGTFRDPDSTIVANLYELGDILDSDRKTIKDSDYCKLEKNVCYRWDGFMRFNKFLICISGKILRIQQDINYCERVDEDKFQTTKYNDILKSTLESYRNYYFSDDYQENGLLLCDDFRQYIAYHHVVDRTSALIFFDNVYHLKHVVKLEDEYMYSEMESSFLWLIVCYEEYISLRNRLHERLKSKYIIGEFEINHLENDFCLLPLLQRQDLLNKATKFTVALSGVEIPCGRTDRDDLRAEILRSLTNLPEMRDEIFITTLKFYLETSTSLKLNSLRSVLVIERALTVIGEYIKYNEHQKSLRQFLALSLPKETRTVLYKLRDKLNHLDEHLSFPQKLEKEKDCPFFKKIQNEIKTINNTFRIIYDLQKFTVAELMVTRLLTAINKELDDFACSRDSDRINYTIQLQRGLQTWKEISLKQLTLRKNHIKGSIKKHENKYCTLLRNIFENIDDNLQKPKYFQRDFRKSIEDVDTMFWPLKHLLKTFKQVGIVPEDQSFKVWENELTAESFSEASEIRNKIEELKESAKCIFTSIGLDINTSRKESNLEIKFIKDFYNILETPTLSDDEKTTIRNEIPQAVHLAAIAKAELVEALDKGSLLPLQDRDEKILKLFLSKEKKNQLQEMYETNPSEAKTLVESSNDPISDLETVLDGKPLQKERFPKMCEELQLRPEIISFLKDVVSGKEIKKRRKEKMSLLSVIRNRILLLKEKLIKDSPEICKMWINAKNPNTKQYTVYKIMRRYIENPEVRMSSEILLQDCMTILGNEAKNAKELWKKSFNLYSGYNLRLALAHGNPVLQSIGNLLDSEDLPHNFLNKIFQLIEDEPLLESMETFCLSNGITTFEDFHAAINKEDDNCTELKSLTQNCERWKYYSKLLPHAATKKKDL